MKKYEEQFLKLLNHSIKGTTLDNIEETFQWDMIYEEAKAHNVEGLIYSAIGKDKLMKTIDRDLLNEWTKKTIFSSVRQKKHIDEMCRVFDAFNKANIPAIALKGLVLRALYPKPDLRTMGDSDIVVHKEDLDKVDEIFKELGYVKSNHTTNIHCSYEKPNCLGIEVHWQLTTNKNFNGDTSRFENTLWNNILPYKISNTDTISMNLENLLLYLNLHMAKHFATSGFGVRQLCDVALLVEQNYDSIDWNVYVEKASECGVLQFSAMIFATCNYLFSTGIPGELLIYTKNISNAYIDIFLNELIENGVHGKRKNVSKLVASNIAFDNTSSNSLLKKYLNYLLPKQSVMKERYKYINKYPFLLPLGWIHNILRKIFLKNVSITDKTKFLINGVSTSKKRAELLKMLNLQ